MLLHYRVSMADVIISGAGPSGSLTALILARAGVRVRVFERAAFPRDKLCGDTLNPGALAALARHLDLTALEALSIPIAGMRLSGPGGVVVQGTYKGGAGRAVLRRDLDRWLADQAVAAGAVIEERRSVVAPIVHDQRVEGVRVRNASGREEEYAARLTIAADGRRSRLAAALQLSGYARQPRRWAVGAYFDGVSGMNEMGEMHVRPGRYIGLAPTPGGLTNVCCVLSPESSPHAWREPDALLISTMLADRLLAPRFTGATRVTPVAILGPMAIDAPVPGMTGLLLAGDAAGFIDPMTGDGLRFALEGAELAAAVAIDVLDGRVAREAAAADLARRRHARFAMKWRFNRTVRRLVDDGRFIAGAALAARLLPGLFARVIRYAGDCDLAETGMPPLAPGNAARGARVSGFERITPWA
jgi:flavin-dependent dehydrogenase